uniref:Purple acid phosphatase n=1 Tax=Ditylenchus dipsaci TaxID=166011 RepID=A0A915CUQ6_9BILA
MSKYLSTPTLLFITFVVVVLQTKMTQPAGLQPPDLAVPEQIHLSLAEQPDAMTITWATPIPLAATPAVEYGKEEKKLYREAVGTTRHWTYAGITRHTHTVTLRNLEYNTVYYYRAGSNQQGWSHLFHFRTMSPPGDHPLRICIFGDLGYLNGTALPYIQTGVQNNEFDMVIHVGDLAYDLHTDNGYRGDQFMRQIEPIAAYVPYMVVAGNHEDDDHNFTNYASRFNMPNSPFKDSQVYSVDVGPVHLLGISSEYHGFFYKYGVDLVFAQNEWLEQDLKKANANRANVPWIISYQHQQTDKNWFHLNAGFEQLLVDAGVDLGFGVMNILTRAAPVYIVTGSAGCHSGHALFDKAAVPGSVKQLNDYGYTLLHVHNFTHLHIQQISVEGGSHVIDSVWLTKDIGHIPNTSLR